MVVPALEAALEYSSRHKERALIVAEGDNIVTERYAPPLDVRKPHALYSGTKSFWGVLAVAAEDDNLLRLDEPVATTIAEWRDDAWKRIVTVRQLLNLTSGLPFGGLGRAVPAYAKALGTALRDEPGTTFRYSGIPLQVFGAVLARRLQARALTPHEYLRERLLDPIGLRIASWRSLTDGTQPLPTGAFLSAREWLKYGKFLVQHGSCGNRSIVSADALAQCFQGPAVNPRYGLGFWLHRTVEDTDVAYASGSGGQALYVVPARRLVVVRFADGGSYKHEAFLSRLVP